MPVLKRTRLPFWLHLYDSSGNALNPYGGNDMLHPAGPVGAE
ncbi:hypothetical protein T296_11915 [Pantoea agglomerans Eh318]|nr:hypothetical protein T296_11915 [Pantoea agglomerans Eh318]